MYLKCSLIVNPVTTKSTFKYSHLLKLWLSFFCLSFARALTSASEQNAFWLID